MLRLFIALTPDEAVKEALAEVQERLRQRLPARTVKWTPPEQIHLTLRFLGDVPEDAVAGLTDALAHAAAGQRSFELIAERLGVFPTLRRPRVLWVGLGGGLRELTAVQQALQNATAPWGAREEKDFHAHLTLGRVRELAPARLREVAAALLEFRVDRLGSWTASAVELFRSELRPDGAVHTCLASQRFGAAT